DIENGLADRLVSYYINQLIAAPTLHDRVEFDIVFSCYTFDLPQRLNRLSEFGFSSEDRERLANSLRALTNRIIDREGGLWRADGAKIAILEERRKTILASGIDPIAKMYWLLEDCKRYGTLPFAGLARAGFIAVQLLRSLVAVEVLSHRDYNAFMTGLDTVSGRLVRDLAGSSPEEFLERYGHLRPGTYDILSPRYDEAPERYFEWKAKREHERDGDELFSLSIPQMREIDRLLREHGFTHDIVGLFEFLRAAIEGREYAKFAFTRNLSDVLAMLGELGFSKEEMSYADVAAIKELYSGSGNPRTVFGDAIARGKARYAQTMQLVFPPLIVDPDQVWAFELPVDEPHYITQRSAEGAVCTEEAIRAGGADLTGAIVFIPSADPGYDWLFSHRIAGFVTAYGGVNSHMAIRAGELNLPAVIGAGETLFRRWSSAKTIRIDAANRHVELLA
ncbi:MAG: phosphoenolpyruvate synthase, partial [Candidatus Eremiobacteraeota bacterium]|nr:phosphoenolpyruvate synthase [Candidatus Eremiobacteraeota bacterium]